MNITDHLTTTITLQVTLTHHVDVGAAAGLDGAHVAINDLLDALPENVSKGVTLTYAAVTDGFVDRDGVAVATA